MTWHPPACIPWRGPLRRARSCTFPPMVGRYPPILGGFPPRFFGDWVAGGLHGGMLFLNAPGKNRSPHYLAQRVSLKRNAPLFSQKGAFLRIVQEAEFGAFLGRAGSTFPPKRTKFPTPTGLRHLPGQTTPPTAGAPRAYALPRRLSLPANRGPCEWAQPRLCSPTPILTRVALGGKRPQ